MKTIIVVASIILMGWGMTATPHQAGINLQLSLLCQDHPDKDCKEIFLYCQEALVNGQECYIIN